VTTANIGPLAEFIYSYESDSWWWSDEAFRTYGFAPGEVVPTTDLVLRHQHPDDVDTAAETARSLLARRERFCVWHRIVDARRRTRQLVTVGAGDWDTEGTCTQVQGFFLDVTRGLRVAYSRDIDEAVRASARTRAAIEQAKGVLMLTHCIGAEEAFEVLRSCSQATNVKVRELADAVMAAVTESGQLPRSVRRHTTAVLADHVARVGHADGTHPGGVRADGGHPDSGHHDGVPDRGGDPVG
jgi:hypothetical protein